MIVEEQIYTIKNLMTSRYGIDANSYIYSKTVELLSFDEKNNTFSYIVGKEKDKVNITVTGNTITNIECSCCNKVYKSVNMSIRCNKIIAALIFHVFVHTNVNEEGKNKLTSYQLKYINAFIQDEKVMKEYDFRLLITQMLEFKLDDVLKIFIKKYETALSTFLQTNQYFLSLDHWTYLIDYYLNNKIVMKDSFMVYGFQKAIVTKTDLTEDIIMSYYDILPDLNIIKKNNPNLFEFTNQSIAFKMFLMMKGV